jgi:hypothetical protein
MEEDATSVYGYTGTLQRHSTIRRTLVVLNELIGDT